MSTRPPSSGARAPRVASGNARRRILDAAARLLRDRPFSALTVGDLMREAGLTRTVFYRHFDDLPQLAPELLPDAGDPLVDRVRRAGERSAAEIVEQMVDGLVALYAEHGPLLLAIDDAARADPAVAARLDVALVGPRRLITDLLRRAPHPPPKPAESAQLLMAAHNAYLLATFGAQPPRASPRQARAALLAMWERLLAP